MLNNITWQGYWVTLAIITAGYYLFIYLKFFRKTFSFSSAFKHLSNTTVTFGEGMKRVYQEPDDRLDESNYQPSLTTDDSLMQSCLDELEAYFNEVKRTKAVKEEFLFSLEQLLAKYPSLKSSAYKESLTNIIISEAEHVCSIRLSMEELNRVW